MTKSTLSRRELLQTTAAASLSFATPRSARAQTTADVIVIGAGLSGLNATLNLEDQGLNVVILEGRQRVGGRVFSVDSVPGNPEGGANAIAGAYPRLRSAAERFGVELESNVPRMQYMRDQALVLDGKYIPKEEWPDSPRNPFPDDLKETMPWQYRGPLISAMNPLKELDDWSDPKFAEYDISLNDFLKQQGASDAMIELAININFSHGGSAHDVSLMHFLQRDLWIKTQQADGPVNDIGKGGNMRVPEGIAANLKSDIILGKKVLGIRSEADGADVVCTDGSRYRAPYVICTIPLPVLRLLRIDPVLTGAQQKAVHTADYARCSQVHLVPKEPFWEDDGFPLMMWTDGPAGFVVPFHLGETLEEVTSITAFVRDNQCLYLDSLGPEGAKAAVLQAIEEIRPAAKDKIEAPHYHSWQLDEFALGADYMVWGPGEVTDFYGKLWAPHERIHFCGQHTAEVEVGMEAAMESGERVALEVLERA
jgi:monoamine oxidase